MKATAESAALKRALAVFAIAGLMIVSAAATLPAVATVIPSSTFSKSAYVQIRAVGTYGSWYPEDQTTSGVVSLVQSFHGAVGRPVSIFSAVEGPQDPSKLVKGQNVTVDQFLLNLKAAAGGDIVPTLNMNYYTSGTGVTRQPYCDPHNATDCGPHWFWKVSAELFSLAAVQQGGKEVLLKGFDQWSRNVNSTVVQLVLVGLKAQGWGFLIAKHSNSGFFPDFGQASYVTIGPTCSTSRPFCFENAGKIEQYRSADNSTLQGAFALFDYQTINSPHPPLALSTFLANLTSKQQVLGLKSLSASQGTFGYSMVYPLIIGDNRNGASYYWDAVVKLTPHGNPFITLEESLARRYG